jgi:hypothetical protein
MLPNVYGSAVYCGASVSTWIGEVGGGNKEFRNEGCPGRPDRHETDAVIASKKVCWLFYGILAGSRMFQDVQKVLPTAHNSASGGFVIIEDMDIIHQ